MISDVAIFGMLFNMVICFALPILVLGYLKIRKHAKILLFMVGISMYLVFVMLLENLFVTFAIQGFPLIGQNLALYSTISILSAGIFESVEFALLARVLHEHLQRGSAVIMLGMGHAAANAAFSAGISSITYYSFASISNTEGVEALTQDLTGDSLKMIQQMLDTLQKGDTIFYISGIEQMMMMMGYCCAAVIIWMAMTSSLSRYWMGAGAAIIMLLRLPIELSGSRAFAIEWIAPVISVVLGVLAAVFTYKLYRKIKGVSPKEERQPLRRLH